MVGNSPRQSCRQAIVDSFIELEDLVIADERYKIPHAIEDSSAVLAVLEVILKPRLRITVEIVIDVVGDIPPHFRATDFDNDVFVLHSPGLLLPGTHY